jgi:hypothetical protein
MATERNQLQLERIHLQDLQQQVGQVEEQEEPVEELAVGPEEQEEVAVALVDLVVRVDNHRHNSVPMVYHWTMH